MGTGEYGAAAIAALDVAEAAALDEMPRRLAVNEALHGAHHRAVREAAEKFRATIAPSKPEGT